LLSGFGLAYGGTPSANTPYVAVPALWRIAWMDWLSVIRRYRECRCIYYGCATLSTIYNGKNLNQKLSLVSTDHCQTNVSKGFAYAGCE